MEKILKESNGGKFTEVEKAYKELCDFWSSYWAGKSYQNILDEVEGDWNEELKKSLTLFSPLLAVGNADDIHSAILEFKQKEREISRDFTEKVMNYNPDKDSIKKYTSSQKQHLENVENLFSKIESFTLDESDPRFKVLHEEDYKAIKKYVETKMGKKKLRMRINICFKLVNFLRETNNQSPFNYFDQKISDKLSPEPTVPQAIQGNLLKKPINTIGINPGLDTRIDQNELFSPDEILDLRQTILEQLQSGNPKDFVSLMKEYKKSLSGNVKGLYYKENIMTNNNIIDNNKITVTEKGHSYSFDAPYTSYKDIAQAELFPYQTKDGKGIPKEIWDILPSSKKILNYLKSALKYQDDKLFVMRSYNHVIKICKIDEKSKILERTFQGISGKFSLSIENLVSGKEKTELNKKKVGKGRGKRGPEWYQLKKEIEESGDFVKFLEKASKRANE